MLPRLNTQDISMAMTIRELRYDYRLSALFIIIFIITFVSLTFYEYERNEKKAYRELESCLHGFINLLPEGYKDLIIKSEIEGKRQKEQSEAMGINYVTLRSKVQRGRDRIRKMIFDACSIEKDAAGGLLECVPKSDESSCGASSSCGCNNIT